MVPDAAQFPVNGSESAAAFVHRLRVAAEAAHLGIYDADFEARTLYWSPEMRAILGLGADDLAPPPGGVPAFIHPDDRQHVRRMLAAALEGDGDGSVLDEHRIVRPDGTIRWVQVKGTVWFTGAGSERRPVRSAGVMLDITDRMRVEQELRESAERLAIAQEAAEIGIHDYDVGSGTIRWDTRVRALWGIDADVPVSYEVFMAGVYPDDRAAVHNAVERAFDPSGSGRYAAEFRVISKCDGRQRWVAATGCVTFLDRRPVRLVGTVQDVTARLEAQRDLRRRERKLQTLADNAPDVLTRFDRQRRHVFVNAAVERATGRPQAEFLGRTNQELGMPAAQCDLWDKAIDEVFATAESTSIEFSFDGPSGASHFVAKLVPELGDSGAVESVLVTTHDVTGRKAFEASLRATAERERQRAEELETILANVPAAVWIARDPLCREITGNPESYRMLRMPSGGNASASASREELAARRFREFKGGKPVAPDDLPMQVAARTGAVVREAELSFVFDDGTVRHTIGTAAPLRDAAGAVRGAIAAFLDVTALKEAQESAEEAHKRERAARAEAERAASLAQLFMGIVGHDLRGPLTVIHSALAFILQKTQDARLRLMAERALRNSTFMSRMISQVLDVTPIRAGGGLPCSPQRTDHLSEVALRVRDDLSKYPGEIHIVTLGDDSGVWDPDRMLQVLANLLGNAREHSPPGATVEVQIDGRSAESVSVSICNPGVIPLETLPFLFEPFRQGHPRSGPGLGLGLGLYITKEVVTAHGGAIDVTSSDEGGTCFTFVVPRRARESVRMSPASEPV